MKELNRREFLRRLSLGAAAGYLALKTPIADAQMRGGGGGGMGGGGTAMIDPPAGATFADPMEMRNFSTVPGLVEVDMEAKPAWINVNGNVANLMTYSRCGNSFFYSLVTPLIFSAPDDSRVRGGYCRIQS
jgi:hypothetical protein